MKTNNEEQGNEKLLREISHKLDRLIGVVAIQGRETDVQIRMLTKLGFSSPEIGELVGRHPVYVRKLRTKGKRKKRA